MSERRGWLADVDESAPAYSRWQPVLQADGVCLPFEIWFSTEAECLDWIRRDVLGRGMWAEDVA